MRFLIAAEYLPVVQTGLQTLCIIGAGRLASSRGLFDPAPVCRTLNRFVVVVCLPALQFWLLAIKTDMRNMEHWRAVGAFMLWTLLVQIGCTAWVIMFEGGKLSRICVHSLILAANNTGILAPVVLEAAVGPSSAVVGMLATIVLYFQQVPAAMALFELDRSGGAAARSDGGGGGGGGREASRIQMDALPGAMPPAPMVLSKKDGAGVMVMTSPPVPSVQFLVLRGPETETPGGHSSGGGGAGGGSGSPAQPYATEQLTRRGPGGRMAVPYEEAEETQPLLDCIEGASGLWRSEGRLHTSGRGEHGGGGGDSSGSGTAPGGKHPLGGVFDRGGPTAAPPGPSAAPSAESWWRQTGAAAAPHHSNQRSVAGGSHAGGAGGAVATADPPLGLSPDDFSTVGGSPATARQHPAHEPQGPPPRGVLRSTHHRPSHVRVPAPPHPSHVHLQHATRPRYPHGQASAPPGGDDSPVAAKLLLLSDPSFATQWPPDAPSLQPQPPEPPQSHAAGIPRVVSEPHEALAAAATALQPAAAVPEHSLRHAAQLVLSNALMWTTGGATAVSMLGLHAVLDPAMPTHIPELGFVEGTLSWLARCSVPLSLFAMGLFIASRPGCGVSGAAAVRGLVGYLVLKLLVLPWLMVFVNSLLGLDGRLAQALVVLTCVPVGQNAFLVTEQYGEGAEAVTGVMQVGLLLMLPHVAAVMALLRWAGMYQGEGGAEGEGRGAL